MFPPNALSLLINATKEHINWDWQILLNHIYREADFMAKITTQALYPLAFIDMISLEDLDVWIRYDMYGSMNPRSVLP